MDKKVNSQKEVEMQFKKGPFFNIVSKWLGDKLIINFCQKKVDFRNDGKSSEAMNHK